MTVGHFATFTAASVLQAASTRASSITRVFLALLCTLSQHSIVKKAPTTPADADDQDAPAAPPPLDDASALLGGLGMGFFSMVISQLPLDRVMVV